MKKKFKKVNAAIIVIGNEILSGRTQDLNISFIAKEFVESFKPWELYTGPIDITIDPEVRNPL